jgi:predicted metal-dependent hydrolase
MPRESSITWNVTRLEYTTDSGRTLPVELRRRKGTRHFRLSLNLRNAIVLSLPWHGSMRAAGKFLEQNREWLEGQLASAPEVVGLGTWLERSPWLSAGGCRLHAVVQARHTVRPAYVLAEGGARVDFYLPTSAGATTLENLVRKFAANVLRERSSELAARHGLQFSRLTVRNQSSRWGSCSSKRAISLNWRLVLIEPALQDYIILHELAHLREMNHSQRFWRLLTSYDPERERHEAELDALTPRVMRVSLGAGV